MGRSFLGFGVGGVDLVMYEEFLVGDVFFWVS